MATNRLDTALSTIDALLNAISANGMFVHGPKKQSTKGAKVWTNGARARAAATARRRKGTTNQIFPALPCTLPPAVNGTRKSWRDILAKTDRPARPTPGCGLDRVDAAWRRQVQALDQQLMDSVSRNTEGICPDREKQALQLAEANSAAINELLKSATGDEAGQLMHQLGLAEVAAAAAQKAMCDKILHTSQTINLHYNQQDNQSVRPAHRDQPIWRLSLVIHCAVTSICLSTALGAPVTV